MNYEEIIANNINRCIKESGLLKRFVAERIGISGADLSNILHGRRLVRIGTLFEIAKVLGVPPEIFLKSQEKGDWNE